MSKAKEKHIERLIKGQKSGINIGSRNVPHHLRKHEKAQFERAIKHRFMTMRVSDRENLINVWEKYCETKNWPTLLCIKNNDGTAKLTQDRQTVFVGLLAEAKHNAKNIIKSRHNI